MSERSTKRLHVLKSTRIWDENSGYDSQAHERLMHKKQNEAFARAMEASRAVAQKCKCPRCGVVNQFCTEGRRYQIDPSANTMTCVGKACQELLT